MGPNKRPGPTRSRSPTSTVTSVPPSVPSAPEPNSLPEAPTVGSPTTYVRKFSLNGQYSVAPTPQWAQRHHAQQPGSLDRVGSELGYGRGVRSHDSMTRPTTHPLEDGEGPEQLKSPRPLLPCDVPTASCEPPDTSVATQRIPRQAHFATGRMEYADGDEDIEGDPPSSQASGSERGGSESPPAHSSPPSCSLPSHEADPAFKYTPNYESLYAEYPLLRIAHENARIVDEETRRRRDLKAAWRRSMLCSSNKRTASERGGASDDGGDSDGDGDDVQSPGAENGAHRRVRRKTERRGERMPSVPPAPGAEPREEDERGERLPSESETLARELPYYDTHPTMELDSK